MSKTKRSKIATVMHEFKENDLTMGKSKKKVTNPKQAIAIALHEAREAGEKVAPKKPSKKRK